MKIYKYEVYGLMDYYKTGTLNGFQYYHSLDFLCVYPITEKLNIFMTVNYLDILSDIVVFCPYLYDFILLICDSSYIVIITILELGTDLFI